MSCCISSCDNPVLFLSSTSHVWCMPIFNAHSCLPLYAGYECETGRGMWKGRGQAWLMAPLTDGRLG